MTKRVESLEKQMKNNVDSKNSHKNSIRLKKISTEVKNLQKDIKRIETISTRTIDTKVDSRLERIEERLEDSMGATANINGIQDRKRRKTNLIVFGLPESGKENRSERNFKETEKFEALCKDNLGLITKVKTATRLGPFAENQTRPRLNKMTVQSQDCRNKILKAAIKLKDTGDDIAKNFL